MTDEPFVTLAGEVEREERGSDVVVVGGGVAGLVAALECAKVGLRVTVLERRDRVGGCVGRIDLDGLELDSGAESFATRGGAVAELLESLGLGDDIASPNPAGAWLVMPGAGAGELDAAPMPRTGVLGIPANPLGDDVRRIIGWRGAIRAYADRVMPVLRIGGAHSLGQLVRSRMGAAVLDRLVTPISAGVYSADPDLLDVDVVAPGLNQAMTRAGSLSGGVAMLVADRTAGSAILGLRGGMHRLVDALLAELARFGVEVTTSAEATALHRNESVSTADAAGGSGAADPPDAADVPDALGASGAAPPVGWRVDATVVDTTGEVRALRHAAPYVVIAAPADASRRLIDRASLGWAGGADWPAAASVELVTLVLDAPAIDDAPRGTGALVVAGTPGVTAKALTHSTAKWPWMADAAEGRQVVRLSYGRAGAPNPLDGRGDDEVAELALADAGKVLGVPLDASMLRAMGRSPWRDAISRAAIGQRDRVGALEELLADVPGLEATGSWVAGTGLASVIPHALDAARRIRHVAVHPGDIA